MALCPSSTPAQVGGQPATPATIPAYFGAEPEGTLPRRLEPVPGFLLAPAGTSAADLLNRLTVRVEPLPTPEGTKGERVVLTDPKAKLEVTLKRQFWPRQRLLRCEGVVTNHREGEWASLKELRALDLSFRPLNEGERFRYEALKYSTDTWYGSTFWTGPGWTRVGKDWQHPEQDFASVRVFTAPQDGSVRITGKVFKADTNCGDGVRVMIRHQGRPVWQAEIEANDKVGVEPNVRLEVRKGDNLRFVVDKRVAIFCDTTHWDPVISYEGGPTFRASEGFSDQQGRGGWSYQMASDKIAGAEHFTLHFPQANFEPRSELVEAGKPTALSPSGQALPFLVLEDAGKEGGVVVAANWTAGWQLKVSQSSEGRLQVSVCHDERDSIPLGPGQSLQLPTVLLGAYTGDWVQGAAAIRRFLTDEGSGAGAKDLAEVVRAPWRLAFGMPEPGKARRLLSYANLFFPACLLETRLEPPAQPLSRTELDTYLRSFLASELTVRQEFRLEPEGMARQKQALDFYREVRPLLSHSYFRPLPLPKDDTSWDAQEFQSFDATKGALFIFRQRSEVGERTVRFAGLKPEAVYQVHDAFGGDTTSRLGRSLMTEGLSIALPIGGSRVLRYGIQPGQIGEPGLPEPPAAPRELAVAAEGSGVLRLSWPSVEGTRSYVIERDGDVVARVEDSTEYRDSGLEPGRVCRYSVASERDFVRSASTAKGFGMVAPAVGVFQTTRPEMELWELVEADWKAQDQIAESTDSYQKATAKALEQGKALLADLRPRGSRDFLAQEAREMERLAKRQSELAVGASTLQSPLDSWRGVYLQVHWLKRQIALANPLLRFGKLLFVKQVPPAYSHLVMQYFGWRARPGGGIFVLERPGQSLAARDPLSGKLASGSVLSPCLSWDAKRIVFSYSKCLPEDPFYHLYEVGIDGTGLKQLTTGEYEDLMPAYLPEGGIVFSSTRRRGYARCFGGQFGERWHVYTLHRMDADGGNLRTLSFHETNEWFPTVMPDGQILYSRWDYVDRHPVLHQNLWLTRPDGTNPRALYGNHTETPHCAFQAKPVPHSSKIVFTASAHHSITGGSIALVEPELDADGPRPITRLTPEVAFPEAEGGVKTYCAAPWPLSENYFLVACSFKPLLFEPAPNDPAALGLYLLDRFGNKELLYRDANIGSSEPIPLARQTAPPVLPSLLPKEPANEGELTLVDVYRGLKGVGHGTVKALRVVQVLPKATPVADAPRVGLAGQEPTKAVLGTVPVEEDGSAYFKVPARKPLLFQALDDRGMAVQTMRSITYLQPGERVSCTGCHERRTTSPPAGKGNGLKATRREPSQIRPGPDGCYPFSYARLVQPILDKYCISCHGSEKPGANLDLTGSPREGFSQSYVSLCVGPIFYGDGTNKDNATKALVPRYGGWNPVHRTEPGGEYGARGSRLMRLLLGDHYGVRLDPDSLERLALWIDANALFYGTYDPQEQAKQLRGEKIQMPELQ